MSKKYVYLFSEGDASMRNILGGKGANLAEMTRMGFPVPRRKKVWRFRKSIPGIC